MSPTYLNINKPNKVDYSLYLVTDSNLIPPGADFFEQVEKAISGGDVSIVQIREKNIDTSVYIERARKLHEITKKYNVPLIVNDRVDVAVAIDAEGIHVGQDDMSKLFDIFVLFFNSNLELTLSEVSLNPYKLTAHY